MENRIFRAGNYTAKVVRFALFFVLYRAKVNTSVVDSLLNLRILGQIVEQHPELPPVHILNIGQIYLVVMHEPSEDARVVDGKRE